MKTDSETGLWNIALQNYDGILGNDEVENEAKPRHETVFFNTRREN